MDQMLPAGTVLRSRYHILELVGHGGMGAVYRAEDLRLEGRQCAVKEVLPELSLPSDMLTQMQEQFYREASTLARLDHPNLPKVSDYFSDYGREYLVMDFVAGNDLKEILDEAQRQNTFLSERRVLGWMAQLLDAIEYLHSQDSPVLHRDIKPANIKLTPHGTIKLVDFGLVKLMAPDDSRTVTVVQGRGTVQYTPLEQYGGDLGHTDVRSDIYSLGATVYHLLTATLPADAKLRFLKPGSLQPPRSINPAISARTERAVLAAMSMHPDQRPANATELRAMMFGTGETRSNTLNRTTLADEWEEAMRLNNWLVGAALGLMAVALTVTMLAPPLP
jgi:serine/threonine-protein kinase